MKTQEENELRQTYIFSSLRVGSPARIFEMLGFFRFSIFSSEIKPERIVPC